ncbi:protocatechuate 3,4-dioxygenase subunit alpha [Modestobacter sp. I12A-02628]|uniref:Protocatechuate 3,4-dioxygenase subunit alpha n=1 Tax=Goekera deserti TaxID=2497753 RepID=A0A7K3W943_9ACTN|nr:protocatechuate 3,4-dioxygenase subunit alpha [Goekera deserti]MPQ98681.1 protocatechuate 3,4-dioxygenase subunit alpha [Goekera deserti]NDI49243.1 protocatechuate 3,4-dioxygenase subunit alpha [Goekera deserti]NEL52981.1 protocatechuate 3,4-dioxygenase subunit alpha [Goekera deserti]
MSSDYVSPQVRGAVEGNDRRPGTPRRGSGFLDEPLRLGLTPSATVGPYLAIGLTWPDGPFAVAEGTAGAVWLRGRVTDGNGDLVPDAMIETWQVDPDGHVDHPDAPPGPGPVPGFRGFGRSSTAEPAGEYGILTLKPGRVPDGQGGLQAPHVDVSVFARGLLDRVVTRIYFGDEPEANAEDVVLRSLPEADRQTLIATPTQDGYRLDIVLQGDRETVFFAV